MKDNKERGKRVWLEPVLEARVAGWSAARRRRLAKIYYRWAMQLFVSARILGYDRSPRRRVELSRPPRGVRERN